MTALAYVFTFLKNAIYGTTNFFTKGLNSNNIDAIDILALGIIGVIYIAINTDTSDGNDTVFGIICLLLAVVAGPVYLVFARKSTGKFKPLEITYFSCLLGMIVFNAISIVKHLWQGSIADYFDPYFNPENTMGFIALSIVSTIFCTLMNNFSMSKLQASTVSAFSGVSTVVTILIGVFFFNEKLYYFHYIGFVLILVRMIGVSYIAIKKDKKLLH